MIDIEEAIAEIKHTKKFYSSEKNFDLAISALEKQIPKKPIENGLLPNNRYKYLCPTCNRIYWDKELLYLRDYCNSCGQRFGWSTEE